MIKRWDNDVKIWDNDNDVILMRKDGIIIKIYRIIMKKDGIMV